MNADEAKNLILEVLNDPPVANDDEMGEYCPFCYRRFRHRHPPNGSSGIIHRLD